jgi:hypothetical protein
MATDLEPVLLEPIFIVGTTLPEVHMFLIGKDDNLVMTFTKKTTRKSGSVFPARAQVNF